MRIDVMECYGFIHPFSQAGYYETEHHREILNNIKGAILEGRLIAVCGIIGSGKTVTMRRLQQQLREEKRILVSKSLAVEKQNVRLGTLVSALFYDLSGERHVHIPIQVEKRERELHELVKKSKRPVVLFVDEAHDLNSQTLTGLKRLLEIVEDGAGRLSIVLSGHPRLRNNLRRLTMEEISHRMSVFNLDGIAGSQREYLYWLIESCTEGKVEPASILTLEAIDLLATRLRTPLQIQHYLSLALETGYVAGEQPISAASVETVLSKHLDDLEPTLVRHGYQVKDLVEQFDAKPAEIRALFKGELDPEHTVELQNRMMAAGLPL